VKVEKIANTLEINLKHVQWALKEEMADTFLTDQEFFRALRRFYFLVLVIPDSTVPNSWDSEGVNSNVGMCLNQKELWRVSERLFDRKPLPSYSTAYLWRVQQKYTRIYQFCPLRGEVEDLFSGCWYSCLAKKLSIQEVRERYKKLIEKWGRIMRSKNG